MLVVSRKTGESVHIGDAITITVVRIGPGAVRLAIQAPADMNIRRDEVPPLKSKDQGDESDIEDLGVRIFDPLEVADAYE